MPILVSINVAVSHTGTIVLYRDIDYYLLSFSFLLFHFLSFLLSTLLDLYFSSRFARNLSFSRNRGHRCSNIERQTIRAVQQSPLISSNNCVPVEGKFRFPRDFDRSTEWERWCKAKVVVGATVRTRIHVFKCCVRSISCII